MKCDCNDTGYTGLTCEDKDYCGINPCENNGTCVLSKYHQEGYYCNCTTGEFFYYLNVIVQLF